MKEHEHVMSVDTEKPQLLIFRVDRNIGTEELCRIATEIERTLPEKNKINIMVLNDTFLPMIEPSDDVMRELGWIRNKNGLLDCEVDDGK